MALVEQKYDQVQIEFVFVPTVEVRVMLFARSEAF